MTTSPMDLAIPAGVDGRSFHQERVHALLWLTLIFWGSNYVLITLGTALTGNRHLLEIIPIRFGEMAVGLGFCFAIHRMLSRLPTTRKRLIALAIVAPIAAETFAWMIFFAEAAVDPSVSLKNFTWASAVRTISFWTWFFLAWAGVYLAVSYSFDVREEQQRSAEIKEQAHLVQLRALHSQINPHFLFNSLNSVSALILDRKAGRANDMVEKLALFLRMGLATDPSEKIALASEIELQRLYLEIEQVRYADLQIHISVPESLLNALVPSLILQPIVENAVKYGVAGAPPPSAISIDASPNGTELELKVRDSGKGGGKGAKGAGIGLANVGQRLQLIYGPGNADLVAGRVAGGGFEVVLTLPLEFK